MARHSAVPAAPRQVDSVVLTVAGYLSDSHAVASCSDSLGHERWLLTDVGQIDRQAASSNLQSCRKFRLHTERESGRPRAAIDNAIYVMLRDETLDWPLSLDYQTAAERPHRRAWRRRTLEVRSAAV